MTTDDDEGQSNQLANVVTDDGMIDDGSFVLENANPPKVMKIIIIMIILIVVIVMMIIPIVVTLVGIVADVSDVHWSKARPPND
jgi:hypothetical protein